MKISTKGRYGLRIMLELSLVYGQELVTVKRIGKTQDISEKYIEQILGLLHKAGLVTSRRGTQGGYNLALPPGNITVGSVLRATEGGLEPVKCITGNGAACDRMDDCITVDVWRNVQAAIESVVDNVTLADLVIKYNAKCKPAAQSEII